MSARLLLHDMLEASGARFEAVDGWLVPADFGHVAGEYAALCAGAALLDLSLRGRLRLTGRDRASFLHNMVTNDVLGLRPGGGCDAVKLTLQGKIEGTMHILCDQDALWCDVDPGAAAAVQAALERHRIMEDVVIEDRSREWVLLALQGPRAAEVLAAAEVSARIVPRDHCGEGGFDIWLTAADAVSGWRALIAAGARPAGLQALDRRRVEAGIPWFGSELTPEYFPMEAGLEAGWISYTKGCYLGQETISRLHHLGHVNRHLRGLLPEGEIARGTTLAAGDKRAGIVTSAVHSPALDRPIALGYVHRDFAAAGTMLAADAVATRVVDLPFVTPRSAARR
jgi:aminomethyltransferase